MIPGLRNWQAALLAWLIATLLVGGGFLAFQAMRGQPLRWETAGTAAALAGAYALYLAHRFRERPGDSDRDGSDEG